MDLSSNITLYELNAASNQLISLDVRNGNNQNMSDFYSTWNSSLNCIDVDDSTWSTANWTVANINPNPKNKSLLIILSSCHY